MPVSRPERELGGALLWSQSSGKVSSEDRSESLVICCQDGSNRLGCEPSSGPDGPVGRTSPDRGGARGEKQG